MVLQKMAQSSLRHNWLNRSEAQSAVHRRSGVNRSDFCSYTERIMLAGDAQLTFQPLTDESIQPQRLSN